MCTALQEWERKCFAEGKQEGQQEGRQEGLLEGMVRMCQKFGLNQEVAVENIRTEFALTESQASACVAKYWLQS